MLDLYKAQWVCCCYLNY